MQLFRGSSALPADDAPPEQATSSPVDDYDPVVDEAKRWENLSQEHYQAFIGDKECIRIDRYPDIWVTTAIFPLSVSTR